mgnify:CR=1 FL=1
MGNDFFVDAQKEQDFARLVEQIKASPIDYGGRQNFDNFAPLLGQEKILVEIKSRFSSGIHGQTLVFCDPSNSKEVVLALCKFVSNLGYVPAVVLLNNTYSSFSRDLLASKFSGEYYIIDAVSNSISKTDESEKIFFVDSLRNLTQMEIKISKLVDLNLRFVFIFDSLWVLSLYHEDDVLLKFVYSVTKILRKRGVNSFFLLSNKNGVQRVNQFFDETIELKKFL